MENTTKFKVGDIVVADRAPNAVQQVIGVRLQHYEHGDIKGSHEYVKLRVLWRIDDGPYAKTAAEVGKWRVRHVTRKELEARAKALMELAKTV